MWFLQVSEWIKLHFKWRHGKRLNILCCLLYMSDSWQAGRLHSQRLWGLNDWGRRGSQSSISESSSSSSSESSVESVAPRGLKGGSATSAMEESELDTDSCSCVWPFHSFNITPFIFTWETLISPHRQVHMEQCDQYVNKGKINVSGRDYIFPYILCMQKQMLQLSNQGTVIY